MVRLGWKNHGVYVWVMKKWTAAGLLYRWLMLMMPMVWGVECCWMLRGILSSHGERYWIFIWVLLQSCSCLSSSGFDLKGRRGGGERHDHVGKRWMSESKNETGNMISNSEVLWLSNSLLHLLSTFLPWMFVQLVLHTYSNLLLVYDLIVNLIECNSFGAELIFDLVREVFVMD